MIFFDTHPKTLVLSPLRAHSPRTHPLRGQSSCGYHVVLQRREHPPLRVRDGASSLPHLPFPLPPPSSLPSLPRAAPPPHPPLHPHPTPRRMRAVPTLARTPSHGAAAPATSASWCVGQPEPPPNFARANMLERPTPLFVRARTCRRGRARPSLPACASSPPPPNPPPRAGPLLLDQDGVVARRRPLLPALARRGRTAPSCSASRASAAASSSASRGTCRAA